MSESPSYADLLVALAAYGDDPLVLSPLAAQVNVESVRALLVARDPGVLDPANTERFALFLRELDGVATEVEAIVGTSPQPPVLKPALRAITLGVAANLERSLFPEQQLGGEDNASEYRIAYLSMLKDLRGMPTTSPGALGSSGPRGTFPAPLPYADPIIPGEAY